MQLALFSLLAACGSAAKTRQTPVSLSFTLAVRPIKAEPRSTSSSSLTRKVAGRESWTVDEVVAKGVSVGEARHLRVPCPTARKKGDGATLVLTLNAGVQDTIAEIVVFDLDACADTARAAADTFTIGLEAVAPRRVEGRLFVNRSEGYDLEQLGGLSFDSQADVLRLRNADDPVSADSSGY